MVGSLRDDPLSRVYKILELLAFQLG